MTGDVDGNKAGETAGEKAALRERMLASLQAEFAPIRDRVSVSVVEHLAASEQWGSAGRAMAYLAMRSEVDLSGLWGTDPRPAIGVPMVHPERVAMTVHELADPATDSIPGPFGVRSPAPHAPEIPPASLGLVLVPGLAFDRAGRRLGRGGGYYDRFLAPLAASVEPPLLIGVCWSGCVADRVPVGPHDVRVRMLLTEHGLEPCAG